MKRSLFLTTILSVLAVAGFAQTVPTISTTDITTSGLASTTGLQNAATSMYFANDGGTLLIVKGGATAVTITLVTQATSISQSGYGSVALANQTLSIPANAVVVAGPFPTGRWNNQYGHVGVSLTSAVGVSASAIRVPQ